MYPHTLITQLPQLTQLLISFRLLLTLVLGCAFAGAQMLFLIIHSRAQMLFLMVHSFPSSVC